MIYRIKRITKTSTSTYGFAWDIHLAEIIALRHAKPGVRFEIEPTRFQYLTEEERTLYPRFCSMIKQDPKENK